MRFAEPWFLAFAALSPFFAVLWLFFRRRARRSMERLAAPSLRARLMPPSSGLDFLQGVFMALALALAGIAAARPQWGIQKGGMVMSRNVVIALDVSRSMLAGDVKPSRLEQAKADIADLISGLNGDNVALVAFRGNAKLLCPLTIDYGFLRTASEGATVHSAGPGPTSIGSALVQSLEALDPALDAHSAIIVLSDGGNLDGSEDAAIEKCIARKIPVFTVGYGSAAGALIPDGRGGFVRDHGTNVVSRLEEDALRKIASRTKARYVAIGTAGTASTSLGDIYKEYLEKVAAAEHLAEDSDRMVERFGWFLLPAIVFALVVAALSRGRFSGATRRAALVAVALSLIFPIAAQAEDRGPNDREKYNSALDLWASGDSAGASSVLEDLRNSKRFSAKAAALEGLICYSNAVENAGSPEDALDGYLKAASAFQSALREDPDDAVMKGNFAIASRDIPALRSELRTKEARDRAKNSPDPAAELARRLGEARDIAAKARTLSTVSPQEAVDAADELSERCGRLADDWIPFKDAVASSVTNREQLAGLVRIADDARAAALDAAEKIADLNTAQAYSGLMQNEGALYGLWKMSGPPPPQLLDADIFCQSNVVARMEDLNGRSWAVEALDMTGRFRNAFPEWAQRKADELASQSTNEPPFSAKDRAEIMRLADETFNLQSSLTNEVDSVSRTDAARRAMDNLEKIKKLMPPEKNNNGGNDKDKEKNQKDDKKNQESKSDGNDQNSQDKDKPKQPPQAKPEDDKKDVNKDNKPQEKQNSASGAKEKDSDKKDKTPQEVKDMLRRAIEREREHNDRKNKNPVRFEIERDW